MAEYGTYQNASTGEVRDFDTKPPPGWTQTRAGTGTAPVGSGGGKRKSSGSQSWRRYFHPGDYLGDLLDDALPKEVSKYIPKEARGYSLYLEDLIDPQTGEPVAGGAGGFGGFFEFPEFESIEALAPIDVEGIVAGIARTNRGEFNLNLGQAREGAQAMTQEIFSDFNTFVDTLLPGARGLIADSSREVSNFINKGLPSAVQNNAILRDAGAAAAGGLAGDIALRRSLYNEAQRDTAAVQYGIGQAQQMVQAAQNVGMQFASMQANATNSFLGQLNSMTMITPAQGVGFAFDERQYQTNVDMFNSTGQFNAASASASLGLGMAQLDFQRQQYQQQLDAQRQAEKAGTYAAWGQVIGAVAGGYFSGGNPAAIQAGASAGGAIGNQIGGGSGQITANYVSQGIGNYAGYQAGMAEAAERREQMEQQRRYQEASLEMQRAQYAAMNSYGGQQAYGSQSYYPGISSAPWRPQTQTRAGGGWGNYGGL